MRPRYFTPRVRRGRVSAWNPGPMRMPPPPPPADDDPAAPPAQVPTEAALHDAALSYLARYAATEASLRRILLRRVDRWARSLSDPEAAADQIAAARASVNAVIARLTKVGLVDDAAFAAQRGLGLLRAGVSRRGVAARMAAKGIDPGRATAALPDDEDTELAAALVLTRKRRIGPFRAAETEDPAVMRREFGIMARAGFPSGLARQALAMAREEAETRIFALRQ